MESLVLLPADAMEAAEQIIDAGESRGVRLRLIGGLAFKRLCPSSNKAPFYRQNKDIDLIGRREDSKGVSKLMAALGYKPREVFNALSMGKRLIYYDMANKRRADIFLDVFEMCHKFNFRDSLLAETYTLPATELLMTKLQVMEKTEKEYLDMTAEFHDFDVTDGGEGIDGDKIAELCSKDWGLYTTFNKSLTALAAWTEANRREYAASVAPKIERLTAMMREKPKSLSWRMRARIGEKARWYDIPDADGDSMLG